MNKILVLTLIGLFLLSCTKKVKEEVKDLQEQVKINNLSESVIASEIDKTSQIGSKSIVFADVKENEIIRKRLYLKNNTSEDMLIDISSLSSAIIGKPYSLINNSCLSILLPSKVCYIDLQMSYSLLSYDPITFKLYSSPSSLSNDFGKLTLLGNKQVPIAPNKNIQFIKIGQLSDINSDRSIRIYLKNQGDIVYNSSLTIPDEYQVVRSSCVGTLLSSRSCYVDLKIKDTLDPNIVGVNKSIDYDGSSFAISAGSSSSPESISCNPGFTNQSNACIQTNQIRSCLIQPDNSNNGYEESSDAGLTWSSCLDFSCNSSYLNIGGVCSLNSQTRSCTISNGIGSETSTDGGQSWSTCNVVSCENDYINVLNSCSLLNQIRSCIIANGEGSQSSNDGGLSFGLCSIISCNSNYTQIGNNCIETNQSRSCTIQPDNSIGGIETTSNAGASWSACSSYSCMSGFSLNASNQCIINVKNFSTYRAWSDNTYALTCENYKNPSASNIYAGDIGSYIYRIRQVNNNYDVFCDMSINPAYMDIQNGLVASFSFDSLLINESVSGNNYSSSIADSVIYAGKRSNSVRPRSFGGNTTLTQNMTTCAWLNIPPSFTPSSYAPYYGFGRYSGNATYNGQYWYRLSPLGYYSGRSQFFGATIGPNTDPDAVVLTDNSWHHYCTILNNTAKTAKTYRDGILIYTATAINYWGNSGSVLNFLNEIVDYTISTNSPKVDEWKLYNRELSIEEVKLLGQYSIYNSGLLINGDLSNGLTSWVGSNGSYNLGSVHVSTGINGLNYFAQPISTTIGSTYRVTYDLLSLVGPGGITSEAYVVNSGDNRRSGVKRNSSGLSNTRTIIGTHTYTFIANSISSDIVFATETQTGYTKIDNVKVELEP